LLLVARGAATALLVKRFADIPGCPINGTARSYRFISKRRVGWRSIVVGRLTPGRLIWSLVLAYAGGRVLVLACATAGAIGADLRRPRGLDLRRLGGGLLRPAQQQCRQQQDRASAHAQCPRQHRRSPASVERRAPPWVQLHSRNRPERQLPR
jgi:hypothetical protein